MNDGPKASIDDTVMLVRATRAGRREAFDRLVRLHQRRALQAAVAILGTADEAADAVQDTFVKAYLSIGKLKQPENFGPWLLRIVTNAAISRARTVRRRKDRRRLATEAVKDVPAQAGHTQPTLELREAVQVAMSRLSSKEARAISLFGLQDLSHKEVAEIMNCSAEAARWYVFNARKKLKVLLKEYLE